MGLSQEIGLQQSIEETIALAQVIETEPNTFLYMKKVTQKEEKETIAQEAVGIPALDPTPEIDLVRDLGKETREETTVKNMNPDPEIDQETDRGAQGPQALITEEMITEGEKETSPAMGEDEVPAKRP